MISWYCAPRGERFPPDPPSAWGSPSPISPSPGLCPGAAPAVPSTYPVAGVGGPLPWGSALLQGRGERAAMLTENVANTDANASLTLAGVPLGVLDLAPVPDGSTVGAALRATIDLAKRTEDLGYTRFWVAEHHGMPGVASSSPPVLIGHIADATRTIRVGSGGVMLPNHSSLVVAEQFGMLEALHPGRIDLGIGRAPGTDQATAQALRHAGPDDFPRQLTDLIGFFTGQWPEKHPYQQVHAIPGEGDGPDLWL